MRSIFIRIYMGMLLAVVVIISLMSVGTYYVSKYRITKHVNQYYGGTFRLIGEGVARHAGEKQIQWLEAIEKLSDLKFETHELSEWPLSDSLLTRLHTESFVFKVDPWLAAGDVFILLPDKESYLLVTLSDFGSSLVRISAFLMLNELGRHKSADRITALENLRGMFQYPIQLKTLDTLDISSANVRSVKKGDISVVLKNSTSSTPSLMAYAPLGNSRYSLVLGKIPFFDWFPIYLILVQIAFILLLMAATSFFLVRPLEKRLKSVDKQIERIGRDKELSMTTSSNSDAIGKLSNTVNFMATRIHRLIDAQNEMVGAISHELRTPVSRIRFRMAIIEDFDEPELNEQAIGIEKDLTELETLIDEVLTFSKLRRGMPELKIESIELDNFFKQLVSSAKIANPEITVEIAGTTQIDVKADRRYLYRAFENLLLNALKYAKSKVEIGYQATETMHCIWVSDDGPGIPEDDREAIFEPFKRLDSSRGRQSGGYGLGLAIVKQIANWHSGKVKVVDSPLGGAKMLFCWATELDNLKNTDK